MDYAHFLIFLQGLMTTAGLIIAIGPQNAFVLKQGILKNHVLITVLICIIIDIILITIAVAGVGALLTTNQSILSIAKWGGAAFLFYYGLRLFQASFKNEKLNLSKDHNRPGLHSTIVTCLALGFLNPHAYLDIFVLLGTISAQFPQNERIFFGIGAVLMSFIWFFSIGYGARFLAPLFHKPITWKILDFCIGVMMWGIAVSLLIYF